MRLATLSLDHTPAMDVIQATALVWRQAIGAGREFNQERDRPRFREAFARLASHRTSWPAPRDFIDALPRIEAPDRAPRIEDEERRRRGLAHIEDIMRQMGWNREDDHATDAAA